MSENSKGKSMSAQDTIDGICLSKQQAVEVLRDLDCDPGIISVTESQLEDSALFVFRKNSLTGELDFLISSADRERISDLLGKTIDTCHVYEPDFDSGWRNVYCNITSLTIDEITTNLNKALSAYMPNMPEYLRECIREYLQDLERSNEMGQLMAWSTSTSELTARFDDYDHGKANAIAGVIKAYQDRGEKGVSDFYKNAPSHLSPKGYEYGFYGMLNSIHDTRIRALCEEKAHSLTEERFWDMEPAELAANMQRFTSAPEYLRDLIKSTTDDALQSFASRNYEDICCSFGRYEALQHIIKICQCLGEDELLNDVKYLHDHDHRMVYSGNLKVVDHFFTRGHSEILNSFYEIAQGRTKSEYSWDDIEKGLSSNDEERLGKYAEEHENLEDSTECFTHGDE